MDFELPLILVTNKEYLESLQAGKVFMTHCLHYQELENSDLQRGDKYDSAIKCGYEGYNLPDWVKNEVKSPRLMHLFTYIKCFFHYQRKDVKIISDKQLSLSISSKSASELKGFSEEYALFIGNAAEFVRRFSRACENNKIKYYYSDVSYISDDDYLIYEDRIQQVVAGTYSGELPHFGFVKRNKYRSQQEFRLIVDLSKNLEGENRVFSDSPDAFLIPESIDFQMERIDDISRIVKLSQVADHQVVLDEEKSCYYFVDS